MKLAQALAFPASPEGSSGLTVRQYFAGLAMQACIASENFAEARLDELAEDAVALADALIAELEKGE